MLDLLPFHNTVVSAKGLTQAGVYEIEEARPLAVGEILVEGNPLSLSRMEVDVRLYPLIPALSWTFEEGNDESNLILVSSEGTPIVVEFRLNIVEEPSQILRVPLERLNVKLVGPFSCTTLLQ
jgi:hypothetical protein